MFSDDETPPFPFEYTLEDGIVTKITHKMDTTYDPADDPDRAPGNSVFLSTQSTQLHLMSLAVTGAQEPWDLLGTHLSAAEDFLSQVSRGIDKSISQSRSIGSLEFFCKQENKGFYLNDSFMIPEEEGISTFHREFSIQINH